MARFAAVIALALVAITVAATATAAAATTAGRPTRPRGGLARGGVVDDAPRRGPFGFAAPAAANAPLQPLVDAPYEEILATRFVVPTAPAAQASPVWPRLPVGLPTQAVAASVGAVPGAFLLTPSLAAPGTNNDSLVFAAEDPAAAVPFVFVPVILPSAVPLDAAACRMGTAGGPGAPLAFVACPTFLARVTCGGATPQGPVTCVLRGGVAPAAWGAVHAVAAVPSKGGAYVATDAGLYYQNSNGAVKVALPEPTFAVAVAPTGEVMAATASRLYYLHTDHPLTVARHDWATNTSSGVGGVYDERVRPILSLSPAPRLP